LTFSVRFKPAALAEFNSSTEWYESNSAGLGSRYVSAIDQTIEIIANNPDRAPIVYKDVRVKSVARFPYQVYYRFLGENLIEAMALG